MGGISIIHILNKRTETPTTHKGQVARISPHRISRLCATGNELRSVAQQNISTVTSRTQKNIYGNLYQLKAKPRKNPNIPVVPALSAVGCGWRPGQAKSGGNWTPESTAFLPCQSRKTLKIQPPQPRLISWHESKIIRKAKGFRVTFWRLKFVADTGSPVYRWTSTQPLNHSLI